MKLKIDEQNHAVLQDGKPVYVHDDGKEVPYDVPQMVTKIGSLNAEAKQQREAKEAVEAKLKSFDGLDADKAKKALETVANLDAKKLIDAGEVEKVKAEMAKAYETKLSEAQAETDKVRGQFHQSLLGGEFARSKFIAEKIAVPADMVQAVFAKHFSVSEDGKLQAKDALGNPIYSRVNVGSLADFDEALETLVSSYPNKDSILKGNQSNGSGANGVNGSLSNGAPKSLADCKTDDERKAYLRSLAD
ncbi:DUF6651 domain-containing protein [Kingella oralis]|jgi:hypothetical protein|uniref:DUF6651 domain-containing protein n=1 Tax=Kingella oralis TaxID=505 RepID=UPI00205C2945|nr:MAG TPA: minor structural protein GP20 [Caudoviricetes sp.]